MNSYRACSAVCDIFLNSKNRPKNKIVNNCRIFHLIRKIFRTHTPYDAMLRIQYQNLIYVTKWGRNSLVFNIYKSCCNWYNNCDPVLNFSECARKVSLESHLI